METNDQESITAELIKRGILVPLIFVNSFTSERYTTYALSDSFQDSFLGFIYPIIESNVKSAEFIYQVEMNRINLFPEGQKAALIDDAICSYIPDIDPIFLDLASERTMILGFYNYQELLHFDNGEKGKINVLNEHLKEVIKEKRSIEVINLLKQEAHKLVNQVAHKPQKNQKQMTSYEWLSDPDKELPQLYSLMINKYKLIAPETTDEQFKAVFTGQPIDCINPIRWIESNRLLAYFLDSVFSGQNWQSTAGNGKLFKNIKGKLISANDLSVAKKGYVDFGKPKDYKKIDLILKSIK